MTTESFVGPRKLLVRVGSAPMRIELVVHDGKQSQVSSSTHGVAVTEVIGDTLVVTCGRRHPSVSVKNTGNAVALGDDTQAVSGVSFGKENIRPEQYAYDMSKTMRLVEPPKWRLGIGVSVVTITVPVGTRFALVAV